MLLFSCFILLICSVPLAYVAQISPAKLGAGNSAAEAGSSGSGAVEDNEDLRDDDNDDFIADRLASKQSAPGMGAWKKSELDAISQITQGRQEKTTKATYKSSLKASGFWEWCKLRGTTPDQLTEEDAARFMLGVDVAQQEKKDKGEKMAAWSTVKVLHAALQDHWSRLPTANRSKAKLLENPVYSRIYKNLKALLSCRTEDPYFDVTRGTSADCYSPQEYTELISMAREQSVTKSDMVFWVSIMTFMHQGIARSDDVRILKFHHAMQPADRLVVGPVHPTVFSWQCSGNKNHKGEKHYLHFTRSLDMRLCAISNLGRLWYHQFTLGHRTIPNPAVSWAEFFSFPLFGFGKDPVSYEAMRQKIKPLLVAAGIFISHVCHAFRAGGAQWADMYGAALDFIKRLGGWLDEVVTQSYVTSIPDEAVCAAAGVKISKTDPLHYWDARFFVEFEADEWNSIESHIFPWVATLDEQWRTMIENKMPAHTINIVKGLLLHIRGVLRATVQDMVHALVYPAALGQDFITNDPFVTRLKSDPAFQTVLQRYHDNFQAIVLMGLQKAPSLAHKYASELPSLPPLPPPNPAGALATGNLDLSNFKPNDQLFSDLGDVETAWSFYVKGRGTSVPPIKDLEQHYQALQGRRTFATGMPSLAKRRQAFLNVIKNVKAYRNARAPDGNAPGRAAALQELFQHLKALDVTYKQFVDNSTGIRGTLLLQALEGGNLPHPSLLRKQNKAADGKAKREAAAAAKERAARHLGASPAQRAAPSTSPAQRPSTSTSPAQRAAPSTSPAQRPSTSTSPAQRAAPSTSPVQRPSTSTSPAQRAAPSTSPAQRRASRAPSTSQAPINLADVEHAAPSPITSRIRAMSVQQLQQFAAQPCTVQGLFYHRYITAGGAAKGVVDVAFIQAWEAAKADSALMEKLQHQARDNQVVKDYVVKELNTKKNVKHGGDQQQQSTAKKMRGGGQGQAPLRVLDLTGAGASPTPPRFQPPSCSSLQQGGSNGGMGVLQLGGSSGGSSGGMGSMGALQLGGSSAIQQQQLPTFL